MGQKFDKLRLSCIDCTTNCSSQEDNFSEFSLRAKSSNEDFMSKKQLDEIISIDTHITCIDSTHTQSSFFNNNNIIKDTDIGNQSFTKKSNTCNQDEKNQRIKINTFSGKNKSISIHQFSDLKIFDKQSTHKTRSSNFSCVSVNLVNSVRKISLDNEKIIDS